jgi:hypothetical protein
MPHIPLAERGYEMKVTVTLMGGGTDVYEGPLVSVRVEEGWLVVRDNASPKAFYAEHRTVKAIVSES